MLPDEMKKRFDDFTFLGYLIEKRKERKDELINLRNIFDDHSRNRYSYTTDAYMEIAITDVSKISVVIGEISTYDHIIKEIESERFVEEVE